MTDHLAPAAPLPEVTEHALSVSILIPCRNEEHYIRDCLRSALSQSQPPGGLEVLVIDGDSDDRTAEIVNEMARRDGRVRLLRNSRRTVSPGLNVGIREARGSIIIRMDAHSEYAPDYVVSCLEALQRTRADNVGGPARTKAETPIQRAIAAAYHSPFCVGGARFHDPGFEGYVDTVPYGCWLRASFDRFGDFDEELVRNQDDEHNLRIIRSGGRIWQTPRIRSWYMPRASLVELFRQYSQYGYWKVRVIQKHRLPASWRHLVPGTFVLAGMLLPAATVLLLVAHALSHDLFRPTVTGGFLQVAATLLAAWCGMMALYAVAVICAAITTARRAGWDLIMLLPGVFPTYQISYGWGFLRGILDFVVLRRGPRASATRLTRNSLTDSSSP